MIKFPSLLHWLAAATLVIVASATAACSGLSTQIVAMSATSTPSVGSTSSPSSVTATQTMIALRATDAPSVAPVIGAIAPDFTLSDLDGKEVTLSDLRGQRVLLNFWASW